MKLNILYEYKLLKKDIEWFAHDAAEAFAKYVFDHWEEIEKLKGTNKGKLVYQNELRGKTVAVYLTNNNKNLAVPSKSSIFITWSEDIDIEDLTETIEHELIHLVDPKLTDEELLKKEWNKNYSDEFEAALYYSSPAELDAFIPTLAKKYVKMIFRVLDYNYDRIKKFLSSGVDLFDDALKTYVKNKGLWRKYLKAVAYWYDRLSEHYKKLGFKHQAIKHDW